MPIDEGTVDWKSAENFFGKGKESSEGQSPESSENPGAPESVDVSIRGRKVKMSKEAADAYSEFVRETRERDGRLGGEIAQLRERSARLEGMIETVRTAPPVADVDIKPPPPELAVEDFREYHKQMMAYNATMMLRQQNELETKYASDQQDQVRTRTEAERQKAWADRFYATHPELNTPALRDVVIGAFREHNQEISGYSDVDAAHERLAELAHERIVAIKQEGKARNAEQRPPHLEGAGDPGQRTAEKDMTVLPSAANWSAKKRAQLRGEKAKS